MELKSIETFLNIVEKGSFTKAAESMFTSQPAITSRIQKLEQELKTTLFLRNGGKRAILTEEGRKIYPLFKEGYEKILKGTEVLKTQKQGFSKIRFSFPNHMGHHIFVKTLKAFNHHFPGIDVEIKMEVTSQIVANIQKGETDAGILYLGLEEENDTYKITPLIMEETVIIASPNHHLIRRTPVKITDLKEEKFIVYAKTANNTIILEQFLKKNGLKNCNMIEINNLEWIITMVKNGLGISFLSKKIVEEDLYSQRLKELKLTKALPPIPISIIFHKNVPAEVQEVITQAVKSNV